MRVKVTREVLYSPGLEPDMKMVETEVEGNLGVGANSRGCSATRGAATGFPACSFFCLTCEVAASRLVKNPSKPY